MLKDSLFYPGASLYHKRGAEASGGRIWCWRADHYEGAGSCIWQIPCPSILSLSIHNAQLHQSLPASTNLSSWSGERPDESRACDSCCPVWPHPWWHQHHPSHFWKVPAFALAQIYQDKDWIDTKGLSWYCTTYREFTAAVEQKQVAQQEAEKARFLVERAEFYKKAAVIQVNENVITS